MENCKSNVCSKTSYLDLRKNLNLTLKQFKTKISVLNIEFKNDYSDEEVERITSFVNSKLSKADLRDLHKIGKKDATL